ncbi:MAG TPA: hypothetical protein VGL96_05975, partial [Casimicrobiaceae bacterium]
MTMNEDNNALPHDDASPIATPPGTDADPRSADGRVPDEATTRASPPRAPAAGKPIPDDALII